MIQVTVPAVLEFPVWRQLPCEQHCSARMGLQLLAKVATSIAELEALQGTPQSHACTRCQWMSDRGVRNNKGH